MSSTNDMINISPDEKEAKKLLWQFVKLLASTSPEVQTCIKDMRGIADDVDQFHRGATIANLTGSSVGVAGGITTIVGLCLAPVTLGTSLIVSLVGIGVAVAGGVTGATASTADYINTKKKRSAVQEIINVIQKYMEKVLECLGNLNKCVKQIQSPNNLRSVNCEAAIAGAKITGRGVYAAVEVGRLAQLLRVSAGAARGIRVAGAISGVLTGIFMLVDVAFIVRDSVDMGKGAKTEQAEEIREKAKNVEDRFQELEKIGKEIEDYFLLK
ncbi:apolipoprotein L3-like [Ascaphus truei]|uniref:apolipoprotein L3-like n=1 Tax=Ascaphus truei TaxID=8439 RepID=UPI003F5A5FE9